MHANGRRLFRAAVRLHAYAAVRTNLSPYRAVFEAFLRLIYRIRQVPVCTQPPYYPPFALEVPAATAAGIFHFRRAAAPSCRFPVVFPSPSGCFPPPAVWLSFRRRLVAVPPASRWSLSFLMPTIQGRGYCKAAAFFRQSGCPAKQVARQNRLPGRPFGFPAECSGQPVSRPAGAPTKSSSPNPDCCIPR